MLPFTLPDWLPWWAQLLLVIATILITLAYLALPFSVFGLKPRLDTIESRLDEIQGEIRALSLRLPEPDRTGDHTPPLLRATAPPPPIPPAPYQPPPRPQSPTLRAATRLTESRDRTEPRLNRP